MREILAEGESVLMKNAPDRTLVGVVAQEPIRLAGLVSAFETHPSIGTVVADLNSLLENIAVHVLLLDISQNPQWIDTQIAAKRVRPDILQVVLGPMADDEMVMRSIIAGARGYLDLNSDTAAVLAATEIVLKGWIWAPRRLLAKLIDRLIGQQTTQVAASTLLLSRRERQVLDLIMAAFSNREIAETLGIEERTVKSYVASLLRKSGAENRVALSVQATQESMRKQRDHDA